MASQSGFGTESALMLAGDELVIINGTDGTVGRTNPPAYESGFYRVKVWLEASPP